MSEDKRNQEYYKETFREVHAPQGLMERMMNMNELKNKKRTGSVTKRLAVAAAVAVFLFAGSNGIAYATTGSTWVETLVYKITLDGVEYDVDMEGSVGGNGYMQYAGSIQHDNGDVTEVKYKEHEYGSVVDIHTKESAGISLKDGRVCIVDGDIKIDVTEELFEKLEVTGSYEVNACTKVYKITKDGDCIKSYIVTVKDDMETAWEEIAALEEEYLNKANRITITPSPAP